MGSPEQSAGYAPAQVEVVHGLEGTVNYLASKMQLDPNFFDVHSFAARDVEGKGIQDVKTWLEAIDFKDPNQLPGKVRIGFDGYTFDPQQQVSGKLEELPRNELVGALAVTEAKLRVIQREAPEAYASLIGRTNSSLREVHTALDAAFYRKQKFGSYLTAPSYASERGRIRLGVASIPGVITIASMILAACKGQGVAAPPTETGSTGPDVVLTATPVEAPATATAMPPYLGLETATPDSNGETATAVPELVSGTRITFAENLTDTNGNGIQDEIEAALEGNGVAVGPEFASTTELVEYVETANQTIKNATLKNAKGGEIPISSTTFVFRDGVGWMLVPRAIDGSIVVSDNGNGYPVRFTDGTLSELMDDTYHLVADSQNSTVELDETGRMIVVEGEAPAKEYLSCADPELITKKEQEFEARTGMTVDAAYELARNDPDFGDESSLPAKEPSYQVQTRFFYIGSELVSGEGIPGGKVKNVLCAYGRTMLQDSDGSYHTDPIVLGYEDTQGNFHVFSYSYDRASVSAEGQLPKSGDSYNEVSLKTLDEAQKFLASLPDGAIMQVTFRTFSRFSSIDDIVDSSGSAYPETESLKEFLRMLGLEWTSRNLNQDRNSIGDTRDRVLPEEGDQGLFSSSFVYYDEGALESVQK